MKSFLKTFLSSALGAFFGFLLLIFATLVIVPAIVTAVMSGKHARTEAIHAKSVMHIDMRGELTDRHNPLDFDLLGPSSIFGEDRTMGLYELSHAIEMAKGDKRISGIYLELHDFQSGWSNLTALRRQLQEFAASGKWIYAYGNHFDEMAYYLATAANEIYMEPYGDLEFKGLATQEMFFKGLLDKLDVQPLVFRVGKFKAAIEPVLRDQMSPENREQSQALIDDVWAEVRAAASKMAKVEPRRIDQIAANLEVTSAESAKKQGLIQGTMFADEVEDKLRELTVGKDSDVEWVTPGQLLRQIPEKKRSGKKIAVIFAEGEIHSGESGRDSIGSEGLSDDIQEAKNDDDVAAIVLRVNSPGGDALASDVIWRALRTTDDELPVVVSMGDVAASGGYYMASAARYIFAEPTTITGSIGVFGLMFNGEKAFKSKAGISFDRVVTHPHADLGTYARPMQPIEAQAIQGDVERVYKRFIDVVQDGRGYEKRGDVESIAEGRVWSGSRAKELGLVDELGGLQQAIVKAAAFAEIKDYRIETFPSEADPLRHLLERFTGEAMSRASITQIVGPRWARKLLQWKDTLPTIGRGAKIQARLLYDYDIH